MTLLTVTARGRVTFRKEVLQHLGIESGDKIALEFLPDGRAELRAGKPAGGWEALSGCLKDKGNGAVLSSDELNEAIAEMGGGSAAKPSSRSTPKP